LFDRIFPGLRLFLVLGLGLLVACGTAAAPLTGPAAQKDDKSSASPAAAAPTHDPTPRKIAPAETPTALAATPVTATPESAAPEPSLDSEEEAIRKQLRAAGISRYGWKTDFTKRSIEFSEIT